MLKGYAGQVGFNSEDDTHLDELKVFKVKMGSYYTKFFQQKLKENLVSDSHGRWMSQKLGLSVRAFCNHNYTLTLSKGKNSLKPDFDNFFLKSCYSLLALSFHNLIPICCSPISGWSETRTTITED